MIAIKRRVWFVPAGIVALGILLLSTVFASPIQVEGVGHLDKIEHAFAYLVLTISFQFAFYKIGQLSTRKRVVVMVLAAIYGVSLEIVQFTLFPNRFFDLFDALANLTGAFVGFIAFSLFLVLAKKHNASRS